jgi:hypothetical protein
MTHPEAAFRASAGRLESAAGADIGGVERILRRHGASLHPLFGPTEERIMARSGRFAEAAAGPLEDLSIFYRVEGPQARLEDMRASLAASELVEAAYIKPAVELPAINAMKPAPEEPPPITPDFTARQTYLDAAPAGVEARWAWTQAGGRGRDMRIIDIEGNWRFTHEDLTMNQGGVVGGTVIDGVSWRNHGTAVLGEYGGDVNTLGITGICADAISSAVSHGGGLGSAGAINAAAGRLRAGDIMLLEMHRPGPRFGFDSRDDQRGYIAVEWWPDDFAAILNAARRGIIVVEAAGNGAENLDDALYETRPAGFPAGWTNPFRRTNRDSGAIVVGAGAPPPGTHGRSHGPDRSRLDFSNWGALIDAQGWGREVTTCGYGDLVGGTDEDLWYTDTFSGTSSASPIVTGAIGCLQGMAKARGRPVLTPAQIRNCLRSTGSPQQNAPGRPATQRIGTRPNLRQLVTCAFGVKAKEVKELKEGKEIKEKDIKEGEKSFFKDLKDRLKEFKEKEKDFKEIKEKDKDKDIFEGGFDRFFDRGPRPGDPTGGVEQRLAAVEQALGELVHFIGTELRPDLGQSALQGQGDLAGGARSAKDQKDQKDAEKLSDG